MNQVWIVRAFDPVDDYYTVFLFAFPDRPSAHAIYARGEREIRSLHWSLTMVPFGDTDFANYSLDQLKEEQQ